MTDDGEAAAARASQRVQAMTASRGRKRLKAIAFIILLVLAGAVIGAGATVVFFKSRMYRRPPKPHDLGKVIVDQLDEVVGLTGPESAAIGARIDRLMNEVEKIRKESFDRIQDQFDASNALLREELGEERYQKWEKYKDEKMGDRRRRHKRPPK